VLHVFPDAGQTVAAVDVHARLSREESEATLAAAVAQLGVAPALVVTDIFGATPCNLAREALAGTPHVLLAGANLPMLLRAVTYGDQPMETLVERALAGGSQGLMKVALAAPPQNQTRRSRDDQERHHHQQ
jgi:PTS system ascorbate-specific IIA component